MRAFFGLLFFVSFLVACADDKPPVPCSSTLPDQSIHVGETASFMPCFVGGALPLTLHAESSDPAIVGVAVAGSGVSLTGEGVGDVVVTITATDAKGQSGRQLVRILVPNRPPQVTRDLALEAPLWSVSRVLLTDYISDPDRQPLRYRVTLDDPSAIRVDVAGDTLILAPLQRSVVAITIRATDPELEEVQSAGTVHVGDSEAYVTQAAGSRAADVPLVARRDGLLRLFLRTDSFAVALPSVTATLYHRDGKLLYSTRLTSQATRVPFVIEEGSLDQSLNATLDGEYLVPGASLVIDIDPTSDPAITRRIEMPLDVREVPDLDLTLVPVVIGSDASMIAVTERAAARPESSPLLAFTLDALPIAGYRVSSHEPITLATSSDSELRELFTQLVLIRELEGRGYYMALTPSLLGQIAGAGILAGEVAFSIPDPRVLAHELGHNLNLEHTACGDPANPDPNFPHPGGRIGVWGFNPRSRTLLSPERPDVMGYCFDRPWISDYHFGRALRHRSSTQPAPGAADRFREPVLVVWGWIDPSGIPVMKPAFYAEGFPAPLSGESHRITARDAGGGTLFTYRFSAPVVADGPGGSPFVHMIPVTWDSADLTSITLDGPGGSAVLDPDTDEPVSVIMRNGQVRSIIRNAVATPADADRVIFSRGIPRR